MALVRPGGARRGRPDVHRLDRGQPGHQRCAGAAFFSLAGAIIYVSAREIWSGVRRLGYVELDLYLLGAGFLLGIATDLVVAYGGG